MRKVVIGIVLSVIANAASTRGQAPQQAPKPSAELHAENDYFVGTWKLTGETKPSPFGPGGKKFEATERLEWMPGGFFLVAHSYQGDKLAGLTIIAFDEAEKVFTHTSYSASGEVEVMKGTAQDGTETWSGEGKIGGKPVKQRMTIQKVSPALYTFTFELAPEGGNWSPVYEGKGVKTP